MSGAEDVPNTARNIYPEQLRNFEQDLFLPSGDAEIGDMIFQARTLQSNGEQEHAQVVLATRGEDLIDPSEYRYLTYRMRAINDQELTTDARIRGGWNTGALFGTIPGEDTIQGTRSNFLFEGWKTYSFDLFDLSVLFEDTWLSFERIALLELLPLSAPDTIFEIDWVKLTAENRSSASGEFLVSFRIADSDSASVDATLFYDSDRNGLDGIPIVNFPAIGIGEHTYSWDTSTLPTGSEHYLYLVVDDGLSSGANYSPAPVVIGEFVEESVQTSSDGLRR